MLTRAQHLSGAPLEKPQPGSRVQIDVKFIAPLPGSRRKHYQYTAIDDCTRIRVLRDRYLVAFPVPGA